MTVRIARIGACLTAAAALVLGVSACSAGQVTQTADSVASVSGVSFQIGDLMLNDVTVAYPGQNGYQAGENANLNVRIFNNGTKEDVLTGVTVVSVPGEEDPSPSATVQLIGATDGASVAPSPGGPTTGSGSAAINVAIAPAGYVMLVPESGTYLQASALSGRLRAGQNLRVTFTFQYAGSTTVDVPMGIPTSPAERSEAEFPEAEEA